MTARVLPIEEWDRLPEYMDPVLMQAKPSQSAMCVVENDEGEIVARWLLYPALLAEDAWIDPRYRRHAGVARKLWRVVTESARRLGFTHAIAHPTTEYAHRILRKRAEAMPMSVVFPMGGPSC